jgi:hypothetical protein
MQVLFRSKIVEAKGWEFKEVKDYKTGQPMNVGSAYVLDLNNSGTAETYESAAGESLPSMKCPRAMANDIAFGSVRGSGNSLKDAGSYQSRYQEPVLSTSLTTLEEIARDSDGIVDETNYPGLHIQVGGVDWQGARVFNNPYIDSSTYNVVPDMSNASAIHEGFNLAQSPQTSMQALVHKLVPNKPLASWHIDVNSREFFITD